MTKILLIDDDRSVRHLVTAGLSGYMDFEVVAAADGASGLQMVHDEAPQVVLLDIFLPEYNGLALFRKIRTLDNKLPVIFITGDTSSETAIEAMRSGAYDYLAKPLNIEQLRQLTTSAAEARRLMDAPVALPLGDGDSGGERFVGSAKGMLEVFKSIGRVSAQDVTVLIRGESGAGKELVARALVNHSERRDKPFVAVNCAAIPDQLLESELFGHERGAFTGADKRRVGRFEQCDGGTIFLDEIGDMSSVIQGKVLRLLQEQRFERVGGNEQITTNVRIIAATNRPLEEMVAEGDFREDLLYRLNGFMIHIPPLRHRREDIPALLEYFFRRAKADMKRPELTGLSPEALQLLNDYDWPGNVRQLQSVVRQSLLNTTGTVVGPLNLPDFVRNQSMVAKNETIAVPNGEKLGQSDEESMVASSGQSTIARLPSRVLSTKGDTQTVHATAASGLAAGELSRVETGSAEGTVLGEQLLLEAFVQERLEAGTENLYDEVMEQVERRLFAQVLEKTGGNQSQCAAILGITRGKVRDRIATFGISMDRKISVDT